MILLDSKKLHWGQKALTVAILILITELLIPHYTVAAQQELAQFGKGPVLVILKQNALISDQTADWLLVEDIQPKSVRYITVTAYSSTESQTDSTPFITANGKTVYDGLVAANFLPFGTQVKFPDSFGDKIFTVDDRMHSRFASRVDIWFSTYQEAKNFGVQTLRMEIY